MSDGLEPDGFTSELQAEIHAAVEHHAPCVPECPVCYPPKDETRA